MNSIEEEVKKTANREHEIILGNYTNIVKNESIV